MFQVGTISPRADGVSSAGFLRRKTGQMRLVRNTGIAAVTRSCSILMAFYDAQYPRESLAMQGFTPDHIEDIMSNLVVWSPEDHNSDHIFNKRNIPEGTVTWVRKDARPSIRVAGLDVTVVLVPYLRLPPIDYSQCDEDFIAVRKVPPAPLVDDNPSIFKDRSIYLGFPNNHMAPWPADTRWSITIPSADFYETAEWQLRSLLSTGKSWSHAREADQYRKHQVSYFDASAYVYYP